MQPLPTKPVKLIRSMPL